MTLTLTSNDLESHIIVNVSSTLTNTTIWFVAALCLIVDVWMYVRTDGWTFLPGLLGHLRGDDVKTHTTLAVYVFHLWYAVSCITCSVYCHLQCADFLASFHVPQSCRRVHACRADVRALWVERHSNLQAAATAAAAAAGLY